MLDVEAKDWESIYQRRRKQAGEIPVSVLIEWGNIVPYSKNDITERIFALSFRLADAAGLRWGDLLNTAPTTLALLKEGIIGFAAKTKTRGKSEGRPWGASNLAFSNEKWLADGFNLFKQESGDLARDYWIAQPLFMESEAGFSNQAPAFWSCANKMMTFLLERAEFFEEHGIRPHSLKVKTISALMGGNCQRGRKSCTIGSPGKL